MTLETLRIATRKSPLALWQAEHVKAALQTVHPGLPVELVEMTTKGDKILDTPLALIGGKGLFVKELENGLLNGEADIAVHSMKDVPIEFPDGLGLSVIMQRADPFDAFVSSRYECWEELPQNAIVGTASLRRQSQLLALRPDLQIRTLRGNVNTRLSKLDNGEYDAIILAATGLERLGMQDRIRHRFAPEKMLPAIGQGAIGIECRLNDPRIQPLIAVLNHTETCQRLTAERAINQKLGGSCQTPIAGFAELQSGRMTLRGMVADLQGRTVLYASAEGSPDNAAKLGLHVAEDLLTQGAGDLLAQVEA